MTSIKRQLREDKAHRDAARALIEADVEQVRALASPKQLKDRASEQVSGKSSDALKAAGEAADNNKGYIAALAGAVILWLAREPIQALFEKLSEQLGEKDDTNAAEEIETIDEKAEESA